MPLALRSQDLLYLFCLSQCISSSQFQIFKNISFLKIFFSDRNFRFLAFMRFCQIHILIHIHKTKIKTTNQKMNSHMQSFHLGWWGELNVYFSAELTELFKSCVPLHSKYKPTHPSPTHAYILKTPQEHELGGINPPNLYFVIPSQTYPNNLVIYPDQIAISGVMQ